MSIRYDWVIEIVNVESEDIEDLDYRDTYSEIISVIARNPLPDGYRYDIGLMRRRFSNDEQDFLLDEQYAYAEYGSLEPYFEGGLKVPSRFHKEVAAQTAKKSLQTPLTG